MNRRDSQVTTKRGDRGETTALSGEHYLKSHPVIECSGALDELRAQIALVRVLLIDAYPQRNTPGTATPGDTNTNTPSPERTQQSPYAGEIEFLRWLLHICFIIGAQCSDPTNRRPQFRTADLGPEHLAYIEAFQAQLEERVTLPKAFILSAANPIAAHTDIAATAARRLERAIVRVQQTIPEFDTTHLLPFVNRLSDTLFMLARLLDEGHYEVVQYD